MITDLRMSDDNLLDANWINNSQQQNRIITRWREKRHDTISR